MFDQAGADESAYIVQHGGSEDLRAKYEIYLHAASSITVPDFPADQLAAMEALFVREDLTDAQIVAEIGQILV